MTERFVLGSPQLFWPMLVVWLAISSGIVWGLMRSPARNAWLYGAATLKVVALGLLLATLLEPMLAGERAREQANYMAVLVDNSQSMKIESETDDTTPRWAKILEKDTPWQTRLSQDFQLRRYKFDRQLQSVQQFSELDWNGSGSQIGNSIRELQQRYSDRPLAGIVLFTDGNSTEVTVQSDNWKSLNIPVYPIQTRQLDSLKDINIQHLTVSQTDFEASPVTILAQLTAYGLTGKPARLSLFDSQGKELKGDTVTLPNDGELINHRFQFRPEGRGVQGFQVAVQLVEELQADPTLRSSEATLLNNSRFAVVDRGIGPYKILYLAGRPNWEFKFIRRALDLDEELKLISLLRIARKEPKFSFRDSKVDSANPLFSGFEDIAEEDKEAYNEPVLIRLGVEESEQLSTGFPKTAEELFEYQAIILDDIEHDFFTQEQLLLLRQFVSMRGGGLLMLGGQETLRGEALRNSPLGELLPVYPDDAAQSPSSGEENPSWRWELTREGWLQPWLRLTDNEEAEKKLLSERTSLGVVNHVSGIKPGASVLVDSVDESGLRRPLMAAQKFGKGKSAAIMAGDLWRWAMHRETLDSEAPLLAAWRQTVRWLIADVPKRLQISIERRGQLLDTSSTANANPLATTLRTTVYDAEFNPVENVKLTYTISLPSGQNLTLQGEPSENRPGAFETSLVSNEEGVFRVEVVASSQDGSELGRGEAGWTSEPSAEEFEQLLPNTSWMKKIAEETGGQIIDAAELDVFAKSLPERTAPVTESYVYPIWHEPWVILCAISFLCLEWGIRRKSGLA